LFCLPRYNAPPAFMHASATHVARRGSRRKQEGGDEDIKEPCQSRQVRAGNLPDGRQVLKCKEILLYIHSLTLAAHFNSFIVNPVKKVSRVGGFRLSTATDFLTSDFTEDFLLTGRTRGLLFLSHEQSLAAVS